MNNSQHKWVKLYSFSDLQTAYIIKGALEAEGIPAMIPSDTMTTVYPTLPCFAADIVVPEEFVEQASELLKANNLI